MPITTPRNLEISGMFCQWAGGLCFHPLLSSCRHATVRGYHFCNSSRREQTKMSDPARLGVGFFALCSGFGGGREETEGQVAHGAQARGRVEDGRNRVDDDG